MTAAAMHDCKFQLVIVFQIIHYRIADVVKGYNNDGGQQSCKKLPYFAWGCKWSILHKMYSPFLLKVISKLLKSRQMPNLRPAKGAFSAVTFPPSHKAMAGQAR